MFKNLIDNKVNRMVLKRVPGTVENLELANKFLCIEPQNSFIKDSGVMIQVYKELDNGDLLIPAFYTGIDGPIETGGTPVKPKVNIVCTAKLRAGVQTDCLNGIIENKIRSGIIKMSTGAGKTVLSLKLISELGYKALVVVNKLDLLEQWVKKAKEFMPDAQIGIIQGKTVITKDCDLVIATQQTLCSEKNKSVVTGLLADFNVVILDEVHSFPTQVFSNLFFNISAEYQFGLTATLERKDGLQVILDLFLGQVIFDDSIGTAGIKKQSTEINIYKSSFDVSDISNYMIRIKGETKYNMAKLLNELAADPDRNTTILDSIRELLLDPQRKIVCMSDRIGQLKWLYAQLGDEISGLFIGAIKKDQRELNRSKRVILGSYSIVNQGFDQPDLNTLVFCTPRSTIEQAIGRIYRQNHSIAPVIIDILDPFCALFENQCKKRVAVYRKRISECRVKYI